MHIKAIIYFILFISFFKINSQNNSSLFSNSELLQHIKILSSDLYEGRKTGTKGAERAKKYIINQFHKLDVLPVNKSYQQPFIFSSKGKEYKGVNVLGLIKGTDRSDKYIVISAHYDHEGIKNGKIYNGADDNASGISALFAFAEYYKNNPPKHSIILAAFDGEELGLKGSKYFVDNSIIALKKIKININLDMISRSNKNELFVVGTSHNKSLKQIVFNFRKEEDEINLLMGHDGYDDLENWTYSSDHANFYKRGIPFLYFGVEEHKDYHEPTDDYENIHPVFYNKAVRSIVLIVNKIDNCGF